MFCQYIDLWMYVIPAADLYHWRWLLSKYLRSAKTVASPFLCSGESLLPAYPPAARTPRAERTPPRRAWCPPLPPPPPPWVGAVPGRTPGGRGPGARWATEIWFEHCDARAIRGD